MKQVIRIFLKDARRLWPEILLSLVTLAAFAAAYATQWTFPAGLLWNSPQGDPTRIQELMNARASFMQTHALANTLCSLLVLAGWMVLIARVVHEEPLVGDRQFWTTRPYGWKQLLVAKALFLFVFLYPPMAILQAVCIASAGLNPLDGLSLVGLYFALLTGLVALPVMALAAVTESQSKLTFTLAGSAVACSLASVFWLQKPGLFSFVFNPDHFTMAAVFLGVLSAVTIVLQYATRRTALARAILIAAAIVLGICAYKPSKLYNYNYNAVQAKARQEFRPNNYAFLAQVPFQLSLRQDRSLSTWVTKDWQHQPVVDVRVPMDFAALDNDAALHLEMFRAELTAADGFTWNTLQNEFWPTEYRGKMRFFPGFFIPVAVYDRLKQGPATLKLTLYYGELQRAETIQTTLSGVQVDIPGSAHCSAAWDPSWSRCRTASRQTPIINTNADFSVRSCPASQPELEEGAGPWWSGFGYEELTPLNLIPVRSFYFTYMRGRNNATEGTHLCTGAPATYTRYRYGRRLQAAFTVENFQLPVHPAGPNAQQ